MTKERQKYYSLPETIREMVMAQGGPVVAHAHLDRAHTLNEQNHGLSASPVQGKWSGMNDLKAGWTIGEIEDRMSYCVEDFARQGATVVGTFIDVDPYIKDKSIEAAIRVREKFKGSVTMVYANQTLDGVLKPEARDWFEIGAEFVDIIGGLPARDKIDNRHKEGADPLEGERRSLGVVLGVANSYRKMAHVHVDQNNENAEMETQLLLEETIQHGMEGRVVAVHQISLAAKPLWYREEMYKRMVESGVMSIACPSAWIDSRRKEVRTVRHNSVTPFDEMAPRGVIVAIGPDNISDIYLPLNDGNIWTEIMLLAKACHYFDNMDQIRDLVDAATVNGRLVLDLPTYHQNGHAQGGVIGQRQGVPV